MIVSLNKVKRKIASKKLQDEYIRFAETIDTDAASIGRTLRLLETTEIDGTDYSLNLDYYLKEADKMDKLDALRQGMYPKSIKDKITSSFGRLTV